MCGQGTCRVHPGEARLGGPRGIRAIQRLTPNMPGMLGLHLNPEPWPFTTVCLPSPLPIVQIFLDKPAPLEVHRPQDMSPGSQNPRVTGGAPPRGPQDNPFLPRATLLSLFGHQLKVPEQVLFAGTAVASSESSVQLLSLCARASGPPLESLPFLSFQLTWGPNTGHPH